MASFQDVTPGPVSSYGTASLPPPAASGTQGWRSEYRWYHHYGPLRWLSSAATGAEDLVNEHGKKLGLRNPVPLLVGTAAAVLLLRILRVYSRHVDSVPSVLVACSRLHPQWRDAPVPPEYLG